MSKPLQVIENLNVEKNISFEVSIEGEPVKFWNGKKRTLGWFKKSRADHRYLRKKKLSKNKDTSNIDRTINDLDKVISEMQKEKNETSSKSR